MKFLRSSYLILLAIIILATFLRLYKLGEIPPSIISDEASIGYNAYSILKTGRDEWGNFLPLSFPAFGDYKLPGYIYATVPSVAIFDLSEFSTRLPSAIFGILTVLLTYFLTLELFANKKISLLASFLLAISPWSLHLSRMAIEANMAVFFVVLGVLLFLKSFKNDVLIIPSFIALAMTFYIYNSNRVFVPFLLLSLIVLYKKEITKFEKKVLLGLTIAFIIVLPITKYIVAQSWTGRLSKIGVFSDIGTTYQINEEREFCTRKLPRPICYLAFNKPVKYADALLKNYLTHYSVRFLFLTGPENLKHYSLPDFGEYYIFELPFLLLGTLFLIQKKSSANNLIFPWLLIFPIASSLTSTAHPVRAATGIPIFEIVIAYGLFTTWTILKERPYKVIFLILTFGLAALNINEYFFLHYKKYSKEYSEAFQYGYKDVIKSVAKVDKNYSKIIFTKKYGEPHIFYLFYNKIDPKWFQNSPDVVKSERQDKWREVTKIGKYYFKDFSEVDPKPEQGTLYVVASNELKGGLTAGTTLTYLDGKPVFHIAN